MGKSAGACDSARSERTARDVADAPIASGIAPRPAETVVQQCERLAGGQLPDDWRTFGRRCPQHSFCNHHTVQRLGIVRRDHRRCERYVCKVLALCIEMGVRQA